ncbi:MAG: NAD(P)-binding domain-containing protein [Bacteroidota bacterium]
MNIGIIGSGGVAKTLAAGFHAEGHTVQISSRSPEKLSEWVAEHDGMGAGTFAEVAAFGEALVLAVKGTAAEAALDLAGADHLRGKLVMDATNPIEAAPPENGVLRFFTTLDDSLMERLQRAHPDAHFVKVFSCVGQHLMVNPQLAGGPPTMFICGNDDAAKATVRELLTAFGWDTADMGGVEAARAIEPLCMLWCIPGFRENQWRHAFKLLT